MHARIAFYRLRSGSFEQVIDLVRAPGGILEIFRGRPGFQSYEIIDTGSGLVSLSRWDTSKHADAAAHVAASWNADHVLDLVRQEQSDVGEIVLSTLTEAPAR